MLLYCIVHHLLVRQKSKYNIVYSVHSLLNLLKQFVQQVVISYYQPNNQEKIRELFTSGLKNQFKINPLSAF